jgi:hypothetical protein
MFFNFGYSQTNIKGQVLDYDTTVPIAYSKIAYNNKTIITDWEGKFSLEIIDDKSPIVCSYKGYFNKIYYLKTNEKYLVIKMVADNFLKKEEIYSDYKINDIIKKVIERKPKNNPEKALKTLQYKNYEYLLVSANADLISSKIDTIVKKRWFGKSKIKLDSINYKFKKLVEKQHIYQTEKVNLFQNNNLGNKETVLAARMAGFKKPLYEYLGLNLVSYSVYENTIKILEIPVQNPISSYGRTLFVFKLIDTLKIQNRMVYAIYFQPKKLNSNNLRGLLYIDAENFAVTKAFYRIYGIANIEANYTYNYRQEDNLWLPEKRKITVTKGSNSGNLNILGNTIKFNSNITERLKNDASDNVYLKLESTPFDIETNKSVVFKNRYIKIEVPESSLLKPDSYWRNFEKDSIDNRKIKTYSNLDSLSVAQKVEQKLYIGRKIISGFYPIKFIDLDLRSLIKYNSFEGFRLGLGCATNNKLSEKYRVSLYGAYGLKDQKIKFGVKPAYLLDPETNSWISASYTDDIAEIASTNFAIDDNSFKFYDSRPINISTFYENKAFSTFLQTKYVPKTEVYAGVSRSLIKPLFAYSFTENNNIHTNFNITMAQIALQWSPLSNYMQTATGRLEIEKRFPKIAFQYTKSFKGIMGSDFNFSKIDFRINHQIPFLSGHKLSFVVQSGLANGDTPLTHLYSISPNNLPIEKPVDYIAIAGDNSFETMYYNEFFSSKYFAFQTKYSFGKVKIAYKLSPEIVTATRMVFGTMDRPERHFGFDYKTLDKGFYESGIEINKIWNGFGINCFYRYGANSLPSLQENLSIKLSFILDFGI